MKAIRSKRPIRMVRYSEGGPADRMMSEQERQEAEMRLAVAAAEQQNRFTNPMTQELMSESHPLAKQYIEDELFENVGYNEHWLGRRQDATKDSWSAATVTDLARAFDKDFKGGALHSDYIRAGFQGDGNYAAEKINKRTDFKPGDILFLGRVDEEGNPLGPQNFRQFRKDSEGKGDWAEKEGYGSHSDIIVSTGTDEGGTYYNVQGGNVSDGLYTKKMYARELANKYAGRLTQ